MGKMTCDCLETPLRWLGMQLSHRTPWFGSQTQNWLAFVVCMRSKACSWVEVALRQPLIASPEPARLRLYADSQPNRAVRPL